MPIPESQEQALIDTIIEYELEMFLTVQNAGGTASCQQRPESFKAMRWMTHSVFPAPYLESYLADLKAAKAQNLNLMTIKYGRMDDVVPPFNDSPLIPRIAEVECTWMQELRRTAPDKFQSADTDHFKRYLASELETLSAATLEEYEKVIKTAQAAGRNLARERYENLQQRFGVGG